MVFRQYFSPLKMFIIIKLLSAMKFGPGDPHGPTFIRREIGLSCAMITLFQISRVHIFMHWWPFLTPKWNELVRRIFIVYINRTFFILWNLMTFFCKSFLAWKCRFVRVDHVNFIFFWESSIWLFSNGINKMLIFFIE